MIEYNDINQDELYMKYRPKLKAATINELLEDYKFAVLGTTPWPPDIESIRKRIHGEVW